MTFVDDDFEDDFGLGRPRPVKQGHGPMPTDFFKFPTTDVLRRMDAGLAWEIDDAERKFARERGKAKQAALKTILDELVVKARKIMSERCWDCGKEAVAVFVKDWGERFCRQCLFHSSNKG